jgi:hypothetical protein
VHPNIYKEHNSQTLSFKKYPLLQVQFRFTVETIKFKLLLHVKHRLSFEHVKHPNIILHDSQVKLSLLKYVFILAQLQLLPFKINPSIHDKQL